MNNKAYYGPQHVGGVFYNAYWRYEYEVVSLNLDGSITIKITKPGVWSNTTIGEIGEITTHHTGWSYGRDKIISFRNSS